MNGIWQLARQSLMMDTRRFGSHAVRFGLAVVLYLAAARASFLTLWSATGLALFHSQLLLTAAYVSITAIFGFSQAISEEKEDETLGLMRLADISPLSIILGKMAGRLVDAALLLAIQFPFTVIAITLGGVSWPQVIAAYSALAAYLWLLATLGIVASVLQPTGTAAARWTAIVVGLYTLSPYVWMSAQASWRFSHWDLTIRKVFDFICLPLRLTAVTQSSFNESPWCASVGVGLVAGTFFLLIAWWAFDRVSFDTAVIRSSQTDLSPQADEFERPSRMTWSNPVIWREFTYLTGGKRGLRTRIISHSLIAFVMLIFQDTIGHVFAWASIFSGLLALVDGTWTASRLFRDEIRDRTWSSLVQTPHSIERLAYDKLCGWLLGMIPVIAFPYAYILITIIVHEHTRFDMAMELLIGSATIGISVFAYLHLLMLMSLYFGWKATPLTLTISFATGWIYAVSIDSAPWTVVLRCTVFGLTSLVWLLVIAGLQFLIIRRLKELAETS